MSDNVSKEIRSMVTNDGNIELSIKTSEIPTPSADEVIIKVEAAPINTSDPVSYTHLTLPTILLV